MRLLVCTSGLLLTLFLTACQTHRSSVGVLTLAPAGMRSSEGCTVAEDKTSLLMPVGGRAMTVAYAPKGTIRAAVVGQSLGKEEFEVVVYFDAERVAARTVSPTGALAGDDALWVTVQVPTAGPHSWEIEVRGRNTSGAKEAVFRFEQLVITGS